MRTMPRARFVPQPMWYYYLRATYYDTDSMKMVQAFNGPFLGGEREALDWGTQKYAKVPGATFEVVKSKSRQRDVAKNEKRQQMVDADEDTVDKVLNVRFRRYAPDEYKG